MSNMSYCAFENTSKDMYDAIEKIQSLISRTDTINDMSEYEMRGLVDLLSYAQEIVDLEENINDIIESYEHE